MSSRVRLKVFGLTVLELLVASGLALVVLSLTATLLYATATARVGYAFWDRAIVYLKGGLAVANEKTLFVCNSPTNVVLNLAGCPGASESKTRVGWTIGYGSEFALSKSWTVKSETSYYDLGTARYNLTNFGSATDVRTRGMTSTIGLNYRFSAAGPVAARY